MNLFRAFVFTLSAGASAVAAYALVPEWKTAMANRSEVDLLLKAANNPIEYPDALSINAYAKQMSECDSVLVSVFAQLIGPTAIQTIAEACDTRANQILESAPSYSLAYLVKANSAHIRGADEDAIEYLNFSQASAPSEGWIATRRLRLAFSLGAEAVGETAAADAKLVLQDGRYRPFLADFIKNYPQQADWVTETLANESGSDLRSLMNIIRRNALPGN